MKKISFLLLLLPIITHAQIITTVAGNGTPGYSGDSVAATATELNQPTGIVLDSAGNIYISDYNNYRIRKIDRSGIITTIAGTGTVGYSGDGGPASAAQINHANAMCFDAAGNLYFADTHNNCIRKISTSGIITTVAGNGLSGYGGDGIPATLAQLNIPLGIAIDRAGNLYIGDIYNQRVRIVNTAGIISTFAGNGIAGFTGDGVAATATELYNPNYVHVTSSGNVYITDNANHRIRLVNGSTGIITTVAGNGTDGGAGDGTLATTAELSYPGGVNFDVAGNMYIAGDGNERIRVVNTSGVINSCAGNGIAGYTGDGILATAAELYTPVDVAFDASGNLYIADEYNNRIRKVIFANHSTPHFTGGHEQNLIVCVNESDPAVPINSLLSVVDTNVGLTETWSMTIPPAHGTVVATYSTVSTGGVLVPVGLSYTPFSGYIGSDVFAESVTDGVGTDETTINVSVNETPSAGTITGVDSACPGSTVALSASVPLGIWSNSNESVSTINSSGIVTGAMPGTDTIIYTIINSCGIVSAIFPFTVLSYADCKTGVNTLSNPEAAGVILYPNPAQTIMSVISTDNITKIAIYNLVGQVVYSGQYNSNRVQVDVADLPLGVYFIRINGIQVKKFVRE